MISAPHSTQHAAQSQLVRPVRCQHLSNAVTQKQGLPAPPPAAPLLPIGSFPSHTFAHFPLTFRIVQAPFRATHKGDIAFKVQVKSKVVGRSDTELFLAGPKRLLG